MTGVEKDLYIVTATEDGVAKDKQYTDDYEYAVASGVYMLERAMTSGIDHKLLGKLNKYLRRDNSAHYGKRLVTIEKTTMYCKNNIVVKEKVVYRDRPTDWEQEKRDRRMDDEIRFS